MKILLTGATGFIGRALLARLDEKKHELLVLSRDATRAKKRLGLPSSYFDWRPEEGPPPSAALAGVDAVFHLAGEGVAERRWSAEQKRRIYESRVVGTRHLGQGIARMQSPPSVIIAASAIGFYGDRGDEVLTEDSALGRGFFPEVCRDWENEALKLGAPTSRVVMVRVGLVLGPQGGALSKMLPVFKMGLGGPLGSGKQWVSWIHLDDVVGIFLLALENEKLKGPVNGVGPSPVTNREFAKALGHALHRPAVLRAPAFALKLAVGELAEEGLLASDRALPKRAEIAGYSFRYPRLGEALAEIFRSR
jgi:uncharacterized protein (TIGR01777 family)